MLQGEASPEFQASFGTFLTEGRGDPSFRGERERERYIYRLTLFLFSAFWTLFMGVLCFVFMIGALRINVVLVFLLFTLLLAFCFFSGAYWLLAQGRVVVAERLVKVSFSFPPPVPDSGCRSPVNLICFQGAGGITFATSMVAWYLLCAQLAVSLDFPIQLPVGDLSTIVKGYSERARLKREQNV